MFDDPTVVGDWNTLATRLGDAGGVRRWSRAVPELTEIVDVPDLLRAWADPARTHRVAAGLISLAAADGGRDDDALMLLLHLLSGVVRRLSCQLADLSSDIRTLVLNELTCHIRAYRWRVRHGGLVANLERDTRRTVLAELKPSDRYYPDRVEQLTLDGHLSDTHRLAFTDPGAEDDVDIVDLLLWAVSAGVAKDDLQLLVESEQARGHFGQSSAQARGISRRQVLRRRDRVVNTLRALAPVYLAAVA